MSQNFIADAVVSLEHHCVVAFVVGARGKPYSGTLFLII